MYIYRDVRRYRTENLLAENSVGVEGLDIISLETCVHVVHLFTISGAARSCIYSQSPLSITIIEIEGLYVATLNVWKAFAVLDIIGSVDCDLVCGMAYLFFVET